MGKKIDCRKCKYYEENVDVPWPVCKLHSFHFEGDYSICGEFEPRYRPYGGSGSPSAGGGGCLGSFILLIIVAGLVVSGLRSCGHDAQPVSSDAPGQEPVQTEEPARQEENGFVFSDSDVVLISEEAAENLSDRDLTYAINEIYARHGYIFQNEELREYYEQFSWYTGEISANEFAVECFNEIEMQNWKLLTGERSRRTASK